MKIIALGSNLPGPNGETPKENLRTAISMLPEKGITVSAVSHLYASEPVPPSGQSWYVNGAAAIETDLSPEQVLDALLDIEAELGRVRVEKNEPRIIDLDLIDYDGIVLPSKEKWLAASKAGAAPGFFLPHLRAHQRRFVLEPLLDVAPGWAHAVLEKKGEILLRALPEPGKVLRLDA